MTEEEFFEKIGQLIGSGHAYRTPLPYIRRWGPREAGNGRFPGHGVIRIHSSDTIHCCLYKPLVYGTFSSQEEVIEAILAQQGRRV